MVTARSRRRIVRASPARATGSARRCWNGNRQPTGRAWCGVPVPVDSSGTARDEAPPETLGLRPGAAPDLPTVTLDNAGALPTPRPETTRFSFHSREREREQRTRSPSWSLPLRSPLFFSLQLEMKIRRRSVGSVVKPRHRCGASPPRSVPGRGFSKRRWSSRALDASFCATPQRAACPRPRHCPRTHLGLARGRRARTKPPKNAVRA
jgi:hypothetical protein